LVPLPPFFDPESIPRDVWRLFSGTYVQSIDRSHRVSLPRGIGSALTNVEKMVLWRSKYVDAVEATTEHIFNSTVSSNIKSNDYIEQMHKLAEVYGNVYIIFVRSSRIIIPRPLINKISFNKTAVIVGMGAFFHIWPVESYERFYKQPAKDGRPDHDF